jgi:hypothetical protein
MGSVVLCAMPLPIVKLHDPAAIGVTVNAVPFAGEIDAMPAHVDVVALNVPEKFVSLAVSVCALAAPVAVKARFGIVSTIAPGVDDACGPAVGLPEGDDVGDDEGSGVPDRETVTGIVAPAPFSSVILIVAVPLATPVTLNVDVSVASRLRRLCGVVCDVAGVMPATDGFDELAKNEPE